MPLCVYPAGTRFQTVESKSGIEVCGNATFVSLLEEILDGIAGARTLHRCSEEKLFVRRGASYVRCWARTGKTP